MKKNYHLRSSHHLKILFALTLFLLILPSCGNPPQGAATPTPEATSTVTPTTIPSPTPQPPVEDVDFPFAPSQPPPEFPADLRFPAEFNLVETGSGTLPGGSTTGWSARLTFPGNPQIAADKLAASLAEQGWQVQQVTKLEVGGVMLVIQKGDDSGSLVVQAAARNPDAEYIAYIGGDFNLWLVEADGKTPIQVTADGEKSSKNRLAVGYSMIRWSPDGQRIAVIREDETSKKLMVFELKDFSSETVMDDFHGGYDWLPDGESIVFSDIPASMTEKDREQPYGLAVLNLSTGEKRQLVDSDPDYQFRYPDWAPRGEHVYFMAPSTNPVDGVNCLSLFGLAKLSSDKFVIMGDGLDCDWSPDGEKLVCLRVPCEMPVADLTVFSASEKLASIIEPVADFINPEEMYQMEDPAWSPDGTKVAFIGRFDSRYGIFTVNIDGSGLSQVLQSEDDLWKLDWSPDGSQLLSLLRSSKNYNDYEIMVIDVSTGEMIPIAKGDEFAWQPKPDLQPAINGAPGMDGFMACPEICNGRNATRTFPEGTSEVSIQWNYRNIPEGAVVTRVWTMEGAEWIRYSCSWDRMPSGTDFVTLTEPGGFHSGTWRMTITVDDQELLSEGITFEGDWEYWEPAGTMEGCYKEP